MVTDKIILTVTQLNEYIKSKIDSDKTLQNIWIKGEISNFVHHKTGHLYFTVKDENSLVRSLMFASSAAKLPFKPENGMKVILHGRVASYIRDGIYNFYADSMEPDGIGALYIAYEQLKKRLEAEGLFRTENKKPLPKIPSRVGVITSPTGAAVRDIIHVISRRFPFAKIIVYPALVQGEGAPPQLIAGLRYFNESHSADVIILGRGGGSIEDLWAFNNEQLAREVAASRIPVISAVGHETDFTICDFVADRRAPTPSAAAEIAVPETAELQRKIGNIVTRMATLVSNSVAIKQKALASLSQSKALRDPIHVLDEKKTRLVFDTDKLENAMKLYTAQKKHQLERSASKLEALNPLSVLLRGFSAVFKDDGRLLKSVDDVTCGDTLSLRTADGTLTATVNEIQKNEVVNT
ncbi:MAG: exodeoxyribonuclease VII large subunit [Clostridia bacterium]|nr:exodeoxyribonuclease VII large subunit [Clostridia bacterium]